MPDDTLMGASQPLSNNKASTSGISTNTAPAPSQTLRRSSTLDETRKRPSLNHLNSADSLFETSSPFQRRSSRFTERRSSNFTDFSLDEVRDIINPHSNNAPVASEYSSVPSVSLAFALLPALVGLFSQKGVAIASDLLLLILVGIFLWWSVTQPWDWYLTAREVRVENEAIAQAALDEDTHEDSINQTQTPSSPPLDNVPEDKAVKPESTDGNSSPDSEKNARLSARTLEREAALKQLYKHELFSLLACFALPLASAYLLHFVRSQLSQSSGENLVTNFNLTIYALAAEARVIAYMFKLSQSRTSHLKRIVQARQTSGPNGCHIDEVLERLSKLEEYIVDSQTQQTDEGETSSKTKQEIVRAVRTGIQPELDALNRAMRKYGNKTTVIQTHTEARFVAFEARLEDAITLAAAAVKNSTHNKSLFAWAAESALSVALLPVNAAVTIVLLPLRGVLGLVYRIRRGSPLPAKTTRVVRSGKAPAMAQGRYNGDRVPSRVGKR